MKITLRIIVAVAVIAVLVLVFPHGCIQPDKTRRVLSQQGYTDIEITGWRPFTADKNDTFSTGFKAKSPNGSVVTGAVTSGWLKGSTVRMD